MKLKLEQLSAQLKRDGLAPVYLFSGDEPFQIQQGQTCIRQFAREQGFEEREVLFVESGFDWGVFYDSVNALSLFASRKIVELRLVNWKLADAAISMLENYLAQPSPETLLMISSPRIDKKAKKAGKIASLVEQQGIHVAVWPIESAQLAQWITQQVKQHGGRIDAPAAAALADKVEGNLLAADQEIQRLILFDNTISLDMVVESVSDHARIDLYQLTDAIYSGDARRTKRVLQNLRDTGEEPVLVSWLFSRDVRTALSIAEKLAQGQNINALRGVFIQEKQKRQLQKHSQLANRQYWLQRLQDCAHVDGVVKGQIAGNPWQELIKLALKLCNIEIKEPAYE